ncbi:MAG: lipase family protein [Bacteroidota bacterium]
MYFRPLNCLFYLLLGLPVAINAQEVLSIELQEEISLAELQTALAIIGPEYPVNTYKVIYSSQDAFGQPDTLSGLLALPQTTDNPQLPLLVYHHGTSSSSTDVPSTLGREERGLLNAFSTKGFITFSSDYLGLGIDSLEFHPYVHSASQAQSSKDMLLAIRTWLTEQAIAYNEQIFITGYSQGGHAGAAFHKLLEEEDDPALQVTAAAHLSGPYYISGTMRETILDTALTTIPGYLINTYVSYNNVYGLYTDISSIFVEPYLAPIDSFDRGHLQLGQLNDRLFSLLAENEEDLPDLFQDSILSVLQNNDPAHPIITALRENDLHNWVPQAPTRLVYCTEDEQVPFQNSLIADSTMNFLGAADVASANGGERDHRGCVIPAALFSLNFFQPYVEILSRNLELDQTDPLWQISPNPVSPGAFIQLDWVEVRPSNYRLYSAQGQQLAAGIVPQDDRWRLPSALPKGVYQLVLEGMGQRKLHNIVVH